MARAKNKEELISDSNSKFDKLWLAVDELGDRHNFSFKLTEKDKENHWRRDKNVRDILVHLYEWHQLLLNWVGKNMSGELVSFLPSPYTWTNYANMNIEFWKKHQDTNYFYAVTMLKESHKKIMKMIDGLSNEQLFAKEFYKWTGTTSIGAYCISATVSHYDWAIKKIKRQLKDCD